MGAFTKVYGGRYRRGAVTEHFSRAARGLIRHILQNLQNNDIVAVRDDKKYVRFSNHVIFLSSSSFIFFRKLEKFEFVVVRLRLARPRRIDV